MKNYIIALSLFTSTFVLTAKGATVISENFNSYSLGVLEGGTGKAWSQRPGNDDNTHLFTRVTADSGNVFGEGGANKYLRISRHSGAADSSTIIVSTNPSTNPTFTTSGQVSFDFYIPSDHASFNPGFGLRLGTTTGAAGTAFELFIRSNGIYAGGVLIAPITTNQKISLTIAFNNSSDNMTYGEAGAYTLNASSYDLWINGGRVGLGLAKGGALEDGTDLTILKFTAGKTTLGSLWVDNLLVDGGNITIPEPSSVLLLGGACIFGLSGVLLRSRRRSSASLA